MPTQRPVCTLWRDLQLVGPADPVIGQLLDPLPVRTFDFTHLWIEGTQREHRQILELIRAGDAPGAAIATREHFETGGERVIAALVERGYWSAEAPTANAPSRSGGTQ